MIGQTLNHRYKIISLLGEGGMGEVYLANDEKSHQQVAVKILARQLTANPESLQRFKREGETLRQLDHPNIVKFIDAFEYESQYVIVMEYVSGGNLFDLLKKGTLPIERAYRITLELCDALIRSHHLNIIHREIKPENVLLTENGNPKLADFGVARLSEGGRMTRTGTQVGTPYYMAPEAWEGKALDAQADIWSLGIMLFEMLAGHVPFSGDTPIAVMSKVHNSALPNLKKLRPDTPTNLININKKMLARDKKRRYQIMREVGVDLEKSLQTPIRPLQSVTSNVAKSITGIQSKVSSLVKARSKPISKTHITDENKVKRKPPIKFPFKPTRAFGLIALVVILLTSSIFLAPQLSSLLPSRITASPIQTDSTLTGNPIVTTSPTATSTRTPKPTNTVTITPTPIFVDGAILFDEDFEDRDLGRIFGWQFSSNILNISNPDQYWNVQEDTDGNRYLFGNVSEDDETGFNFGSIDWKNYVLSFRVKVIQQGGDINNEGFQISVRNSPTADGCPPLGYVMGFGKFWYLGSPFPPISANGNCPFQHLVDAPTKGIELDHSYTVRVELFNSEIKVFVDGVLIHKLTNDRSPNGGVGISISNGAQTSFDDIRVTELISR